MFCCRSYTEPTIEKACSIVKHTHSFHLATSMPNLFLKQVLPSIEGFCIGIWTLGNTLWSWITLARIDERLLFETTL